MAEVLRVDHFSITVSDLDRSVKFYTDVLGAKFLEHGDVTMYPCYADIVGVEGAKLDIAFLDLYGITLELIKYAAAEAPSTNSWTNNIGASHICLCVSDMDEMIQKLKDNNVTLRSFKVPTYVDDGPNEGVKALYCEDPDGYPFEIIEGVLSCDDEK